MRDLIRHIIKEETHESTKEIKFLKKFYDIEVSSTKDGKKIRTYVEFIPKDSDNEMTPSLATSSALWTNMGNGKLDFHDSTYIRQYQMPLLSYAQIEHHLDNYVDYLHRKEAKKIVS
jgi:hypothetical protein